MQTGMQASKQGTLLAPHITLIQIRYYKVNSKQNKPVQTIHASQYFEHYIQYVKFFMESCSDIENHTITSFIKTKMLHEATKQSL